VVGPVFWLVSDPVGPLADLAYRTLYPVVAVGLVGTELGPAESAEKLGSPTEYFVIKLGLVFILKLLCCLPLV